MINKTGNQLLASVLISLVWIAILTIGVVLAWLFDGEEFLVRTIIIIPFSFGGMYISHRTWHQFSLTKTND